MVTVEKEQQCRLTYKAISLELGKTIFEYFDERVEALEKLSTCSLVRTHGMKRVMDLFETYTLLLSNQEKMNKLKTQYPKLCDRVKELTVKGHGKGMRAVDGEASCVRTLFSTFRKLEYAVFDNFILEKFLNYNNNSSVTNSPPIIEIRIFETADNEIYYPEEIMKEDARELFRIAKSTMKILFSITYIDAQEATYQYERNDLL